MALISELNAVTADVLTIPLPTVSMYSRVLREAELISKKGRGRGAAHATPLDAARLVLALMSTPSPSQAADCVIDFGSLVENEEVEWASRGREKPDPFTLEEAYGLQHKKHTFEEAVAAIIAGFNQEQFARSCFAAARQIPGSIGRPSYSLPTHEISVIDTALSARVRLDRHEYRYGFAALADCGGGASLNQAIGAYTKVAAKYRRGITSYRVVGADKLRKIALVVNGGEIDINTISKVEP